MTAMVRAVAARGGWFAEIFRPRDVVGVVGGLRRLRWTLLRNTVSARLAGSRLRLALVLFFSILFWLGLFLLFRNGFRFLSDHQMIAGPLIEMLFRIFFSSLLVMLVFSTGIILYASLFASREAEYLLTQPIDADRIFSHKFEEAMFFSCWGFFLLGSPLMIAYGVTAGAPPLFYALALMYFLSFAFLPGSVGAVACLAATLLMPRRRREFLIVLCTALALAAGWLIWRVWLWATTTGLTRQWVGTAVQQINMGSVWFLPSQWISRGILAATYEGGLYDSMFYLGALLSNSLMAYLIAALCFRRFYRRGYNRVHSDALSRRPRRPITWGFNLFNAALFPLPRPIRVLLIKDVRIFVRDPVQWSQVLIFSGLLGFYLLNLGRMSYYTANPYWRTLIGFFNLSVTGLLLSTYTSRFIFPLMSLEGQKFWILGLSPISRSAILWSKFAFAAGGALFVTVTLTLVGAWLLRMEAWLVVLQLLTVAILCLGVSAIAVGLGARFPDRKQSDPSKIAAGFGGTLNLVASLLFILTVIATMALPCHLYSITQAALEGSADVNALAPRPEGLTAAQFRLWLSLGLAGNVTLGALAVFFPMRLGIRAFRAMEF